MLVCVAIMMFYVVLVILVKSQSACGRETARNRAFRSRQCSGMHTAAASRVASVEADRARVEVLMMSRPASRFLPSLAFFQSGFGTPQMAIQRKASVTASGNVEAERWQSSETGCWLRRFLVSPSFRRSHSSSRSVRNAAYSAGWPVVPTPRQMIRHPPSSASSR